MTTVSFTAAAPAARANFSEPQAIRFGRRDLRAALERLTPEDLAVALKHRYVPIFWQPGQVLYVAADAAGERLAAARGLTVIGRVPPVELAAALEAVFGSALVEEASSELAERTPHLSALRRVMPRQLGLIALTAMVLGVAGLFAPAAIGLSLAFAGALFFLAVIGLRLLGLMPPAGSAALRPARLSAAQLPVYTVLVPLYRETNMLRQLIAGLEALDYPRDRLDIKLILEESDTYMRRAVARLAPEPPFEVLTVPCRGPQTKPKALNYGLAFARGDLITIFDAEDIPEPRQLLQAARLFAAAPPEIACLQARLAFYNPAENWLTRGIMAQTPQG